MTTCWDVLFLPAHKQQEGKNKDYEQPFSDYAISKIENLNLHISYERDELDQFFLDPTIQAEIKRMLVADMIRWKFGRLIEYYILFDRALFLKENRYETQLIQFFDELISPRNIGIVALST